MQMMSTMKVIIQQQCSFNNMIIVMVHDLMTVAATSFMYVQQLSLRQCKDPGMLLVSE